MSNLEPPNPPIDFDEPSAETLLRAAEAHIRRLEGVLALAGIPIPPRGQPTLTEILARPYDPPEADEDVGC